MAVERGTPEKEDAATAARIDKLEAVLRENESLRTKTRVFSLVGILALVVILSVFALRLASHLKSSYVDAIEENPEVFMKTFVYDTNLHHLVASEAEAALIDLQKNALKNYSRALMENLEASMPEIEAQARKISDDMLAYTQEDIAERMKVALTASLEQAMTDLAKKYPQVGDADLEKHYEAAKNHFIVRLTDAIEERYANVEDSLKGIDDTVKEIGKGPGSEELNKLSQEEVASLFLDAIIDVIIHELRPEMGAQPVMQ